MENSYQPSQLCVFVSQKMETTFPKYVRLRTDGCGSIGTLQTPKGAFCFLCAFGMRPFNLVPRVVVSLSLAFSLTRTIPLTPASNTTNRCVYAQTHAHVQMHMWGACVCVTESERIFECKQIVQLRIGVETRIVLVLVLARKKILHTFKKEFSRRWG